MGFQNQSFQKRHKVSESETLLIMNYLKENNHVAGFSKTEVEEDKSGVDFYVDTINGEKNQPVQFKLRREKWRDLPICRFQPFRGYTRSTVGRDYRSLKDGKNIYYYVASSGNGRTFDRLTITKTSKIVELIDQAEKEWFPNETPWEYFSEELYAEFINKKVFNKKLLTAKNGVEVWFKKNFDKVESFGKINLYVPERYADVVVDLNNI